MRKGVITLFHISSTVMQNRSIVFCMLLTLQLKFSSSLPLTPRPTPVVCVSLSCSLALWVSTCVPKRPAGLGCFEATPILSLFVFFCQPVLNDSQIPERSLCPRRDATVALPLQGQSFFFAIVAASGGEGDGLDVRPVTQTPQSERC